MLTPVNVIDVILLLTSNIYDAIGDFYNWRQMPKYSFSGGFFDYPKCTRGALEKLIDNLKANYRGWLNVDLSTRNATFASVASSTAEQTGAEYEGLYKFCNWVYVACNGDADILKWFSGGEFSSIDYLTKTVTQDVADLAQQTKENIEYGLQYQGDTEKALLERVLPIVLVLGACYVAKKVLF